MLKRWMFQILFSIGVILLYWLLDFVSGGFREFLLVFLVAFLMDPDKIKDK